MQETLIRFLGWENLLEKDRLPTPVFLGFPCGSAGKESACDMGGFWSLSWEDSLVKGKDTHPSILAWRIPSDMTERLSLSLFAQCQAVLQLKELAWK